MSEKKAILALADGTVFYGRALGHEGESCGEAVFNTAMTGYQEILTDPSYKGQIITMTCPQIGNYGVNLDDIESRQIWAEGFVVKEASRQASNWRATHTLQEYLSQAGVVGISGIDTRALTRHLREHGSQQAVISHVDLDPTRASRRAQEAPGIVGRDLVKEVTTPSAYPWNQESGRWRACLVSPSDPKPINASRPYHVVAFDFGMKLNILRCLVDVGCEITVVPASTSAEEIHRLKPDGIFLSNGPGDPEGVPYAVKTVQQLLGSYPLFGICLGNQILGLACGLKTRKLKFGHHGGNHPVLNLLTRQVEITAQNHNFMVEVDTQTDSQGGLTTVTTPYGRVAVTHISLNDHSVEGLSCLDQSAFSVQYHPEASPGPHDAAYLFEQFTGMMRKHVHA